LRRLIYLISDNLGYFQVDKGTKGEKHFSPEIKKRRLTLVHHYLSSPWMNTFVERINGIIQSEYLNRYYEKTSRERNKEILYDCLLEYNFYQPLRSLNLLTPIEYCSKLINNKEPSRL